MIGTWIGTIAFLLLLLPTRARGSSVRGATAAPLRDARECAALCQVSCKREWSLLTACYQPSWGCFVGCARACQEDGQKETCEAACDVQFDGKRCEVAGCRAGCRSGLSREYKLDGSGSKLDGSGSDSR
jgi:hypothetical protein